MTGAAADDARHSPPLVILGCGFLGAAVARHALVAPAASDGSAPPSRVIATVREPAHARALAASVPDARRLEVHAEPALTAARIADLLPAGARVLVAFPPDGHTDASIAPAVAARAAAVVYVSTTGVYGEARGHVDEATAVDPRAPRAATRLAAEQFWRETAGAVVLRAAGIYGPGRGLHLRLARGEYRLPGDGANVVSRVHVDDLAAIVLAALARGPRGAVYVVADDAPVPQREAIAWLCARMGVALPASVPLAEAAETLRHDRRVDNAKVKRELAVALRYPSYREGFAQCLAADGIAPRA